MSSEMTIRVNFGNPMPLFPLSAPSLMPQGVLPVNIFEPRYKQLITDALDGAGQIAMAVFEGGRWMHEYHGRPPLRPAVCIGQIMHHVKLPDERYAIMLQGICRARIVQEVPPDSEKLYRRAYLEPVGLDMGDETQLAPYRRRLTDALDRKPLSDLKNAGQFVEHLRNEDVPTMAIVELLGLTFLTDAETRYRLLETGDAKDRVQIVAGELRSLESLLKRAAPQRSVTTPKGCSWN